MTVLQDIDNKEDTYRITVTSYNLKASLRLTQNSHSIDIDNHRRRVSSQASIKL